MIHSKRFTASLHALRSVPGSQSKCSSNQYIAILVDSTRSNGYLVAERIRKLFYDSIGDLKLRLTYDLDETPQLQNPDKFGAHEE